MPIELVRTLFVASGSGVPALTLPVIVTSPTDDRHGTGDNVCGTLTSEIVKLQKKIKVDHTLAMELWRTGNAEARILALQVSDPQRLTRADADRLLRDGQTLFLGCYLAGLLGRSPIARGPCADRWPHTAGQ